jgi:hypothetical protein
MYHDDRPVAHAKTRRRKEEERKGQSSAAEQHRPSHGPSANGDQDMAPPDPMRMEPVHCVRSLACIGMESESSDFLCVLAPLRAPTDSDRSQWTRNALCHPYRACATHITDPQGVTNPSAPPIQHPVHPVHPVRIPPRAPSLRPCFRGEGCRRRDEGRRAALNPVRSLLCKFADANDPTSLFRTSVRQESDERTERDIRFQHRSPARSIPMSLAGPHASLTIPGCSQQTLIHGNTRSAALGVRAACARNLPGPCTLTDRQLE